MLAYLGLTSKNRASYI